MLFTPKLNYRCQLQAQPTSTGFGLNALLKDAMRLITWFTAKFLRVAAAAAPHHHHHQLCSPQKSLSKIHTYIC